MTFLSCAVIFFSSPFPFPLPSFSFPSFPSLSFYFDSETYSKGHYNLVKYQGQVASPVIFQMGKRLLGKPYPQTLLQLCLVFRKPVRWPRESHAWRSAVTGEFWEGFCFFILFFPLLRKSRNSDKLRCAGDICVFFKVGSELLKPIKGQQNKSLGRIH